MPKKPLPIVIERPLGREQCLGISHGGIVEIDPRQDSKEYLDTLIHEALHEYKPQYTEKEVTHLAHYLTRIIWRARFRKISH